MSISPARAPIRCLVIQLARLGDTLQSLMALRAAKELYPELEIHFVARDRFATAARRVPWIDEVIALPTDELLSPVLAGKKRESQALRELARWVGPLASHRWDLLINWSYSEASSYLAGLLLAKVKLGFSRQKDLSLSSGDGWSHYIQAFIQGGIPQNIHLTDILTTQLLTALQIHYGEPATDGNTPATSKDFFSSEFWQDSSEWARRDRSQRWIAVQLGASQESKTWSPENWAQVAARISKRHPEYRFALLGGREDLHRSQRFLKTAQQLGLASENILNFVNQTDFDLWSAIIAGSQWVFSADTAAIHLASILGTRVLNVSVGPVRWTETGPYGNGHYVISAHHDCAACLAKSTDGDLHTCRSVVTPEVVYGAWTYGATEWSHHCKLPLETHFRQLGWSENLKAVEVYRAKIRGADDGGGVIYESLCRRPLDLEKWTAVITEQMGRAWYCGWTPPIGQGIARENIGPDLVKKLRELEESSKVLTQICEEATRLASILHERSENLKSERLMSLEDKSDLNQLSTSLHELDTLLHRLGQTHSPLLAFSQMSQVLMHNLAGAKLVEVAGESVHSYRQLAEGAALMQSWVKHCLALVKPVALSVTPSREKPSEETTI